MDVAQQSTSPSSSSAVTDVVIIGGGPVGMVLALSLARMKVRSVLLEQSSGPLMYPRGNTHNCRTMEHYRRLGIADDVRSVGLPQDMAGDVIYLSQFGGHELYRHRMPSSAAKRAEREQARGADQVLEPLHRANQMYVEQVLAAKIDADPLVDVRHRLSFRSFVERDDGVEVHAEEADSGRGLVIEGRFLVGSDGPRSDVRLQLGIDYVGEDGFASSSFMGGPMRSSYVRIPQIHRDFVAMPGWQYWVITDQILNFVSLDGGDEFLFHTVAGGGEGRVEDPTQTIGRSSQRPIEVELLDTREWIAGRALVAEHYGHGRAFIAGDAAHLFTPTGGLGMNTGVDDIANLSWKLAAQVQGWGGPHLAASYELERRPVAERNTTIARGFAADLRGLELSDVLDRDDQDGVAARLRAAKVLPGVAQEFASLGAQLGARYDGSPLIAAEPGSSPPVDDPVRYQPSAVPGGRAPHLWRTDGSSLFDHFGRGFTLLVFQDGQDDSERAVEQACAHRGIPLTVRHIDESLGRELYERRFALIRPDQHVAWRGDAVEDAQELVDRSAGWSGGRTRGDRLQQRQTVSVRSSGP